MKNNFTPSLRLLPLLVLASGLASGPVSTARETPGARAQPGLTGSGQDKLKEYTFAQRAEFAIAAREIALRLDERFAELGSSQAGAPANDARARALAEARSSRAILEERIGKIAQAIPENWESMRNEVLKALTQVQSAYERLAAI